MKTNAMSGGYHGRLLLVDLSSCASKIELLDPAVSRSYLGGNGFAIRELLNRMPANIDPFSPENVVVLATGPWSDTPIPGSSRACIASKSPLTGIFYDSTFGGRFPTTLKRTGFDYVVITGAAASASYIVIGEEGVTFESAEHLVGTTIKAAVEAIRAVEGDRADVLAIGPAGEHRVRFACAGHYWQNREGFAGRGGLGAVMGAKNLKAIVVKGAQRSPIAQRAVLEDFLHSHRSEVRKGTAGLTEYGTPMLANFLNTLGAIGTRNMARETWSMANNVSGERLRKDYWSQNTTCFVCPVACGKDVKIDAGRFAGTHVKMPEWETIYAFGSLIENADIEVIIKAAELCDSLGMDTISMGVTIAFAYDCFDRGLLTESDVGCALHYGDGEPIFDLVAKTAKREGIGELLAEGSARMAEHLGPQAKRSLLTVKGLELPGHSARALKGMTIGYATASRGGSHHDARPTPFYVGREDRRDPTTAPAFAVRSQHFTAVGDSLVQCRFVGERGGYGLFIDETYALLLRYVTGWDCDPAEINQIGERIYNAERMFNVREYVRRADDRLPWKMMNEPIPDGPSKGMYSDDTEFQSMLDEYYRIRGWDSDGIPSAAKLSSLGIGSDVVSTAVREHLHCKVEN